MKIQASLNLGMNCNPYLLDEDLPQSGLAEGVVLQVEAVKAVESVLVGVHVQGVNIQLVPAPVIRCSAFHHAVTYFISP